MVGHTGDIEATIVACKAADEAVKVKLNFQICWRISVNNVCFILKTR